MAQRVFRDVTAYCHDDPHRPCHSAWLTDLVRAHRVRLVALARRRGLPAEEAFDCVQDAFATFLRLPEAIALVDRPEESAKMLTTLLNNAARTRRRAVARSLQRRAEVPVEEFRDASVGPEQAAGHAEDRAQLEHCLLELDDVQRAVVTLRMLEDLPGDRVAETLGLTAGHVAVLLHRARANLRGCMAAAGHTDESIVSTRAVATLRRTK